MKILDKDMPKRGWLLLLCFGVWLVGASALGLPINICSHRHVTYPASGSSLGSSGIVYFNTSDTKSYDSSSFVNPCVTSFNVEPKCAVHFHLVRSKFRGCYEGHKGQIILANSKVCDPRCTYLFAYDSDYFNASIKFYFIGDTWDYSAMSKQTILGFCRSVHDNSIGKVNFNMTFKVKEKIFTVDGTSQDTDSPGVIRSVNFPYGYTQHDDVYLYKIQSRNQDDFVRVTFDDWDLDAASTLEVDDGASSFYYGSSNRPILTSITNVLQFRFSTRSSYGTDTTSVRHMGFKLTYEFVPSQPDDDTSTDCGAYDLNSSGGVIEFTGPPRTHNPAAYDCVWVLKRQPQYNNVFLKLLKTTNYRSSSWTIPNRFEVHYGLTSDSQNYRSFPPTKTDDAKIGFKSTRGFYIRLKGSFFQEDSFKMAFASFDSLPDGSEQCTHGLFTCSNRRCIYEKLKCDGVDHCGDNSDETSCPSPTDWSPTGSPFSLSVSIIIPIVVAMFLVIVICLFVVFLRRCQQAQRRQNGRNNQVPSVSGRMARGRRTRRSQIRVTIQQEYEDAPPTYEEAIGTPPNLGYFNMAFMWSQPDIPQTGLVSPPPYAEVIGGPEEESGNSPHYPAENDPNRRLTASDSLRSSARRDRRQGQLQTRTDADHQQSNHPAQSPQAGDLHIVLRRNSNTPSSGNNSLEHSQHSVGRQPLHVPVDALYGSDAHRRNKVKDTTASPQISVTNDGNKDICEHGSSDNQQSANHVQAQEDSSQGAGMHLQTGQSSRTAVSRYHGDASSAATGNPRVAAPRPTSNPQEAAATTVSNPRDAASPPTGNPHTNKQRGGKAPRRRYHQRNPYPDARNSNDNNPYTQPHNSSILGFNPSSRSDNVPHADNTGHTPPSNAEAIPGHLSGPRLPPSRRGMRPCYSYADIPTAAESYRPPDPRRASSAGRLVSDECSAVGEADIGAIAEVPEDTLPTAVPTQTEDCNDGEEAYKQRLSQSSQQIRLFLQRTASEDEDMYV